MRIVLCDYCGDPAQLVTGAVVYPHRKDLHDLKFWRCVPCGAFVGCYRNSDFKPMGRLSNAELRVAKKKAHSHFDATWKDGSRSRTEAYAWLARRMRVKPKKCHIGMFDLSQCEEVISHCSEYHPNPKGNE